MWERGFSFIFVALMLRNLGKTAGCGFIRLEEAAGTGSSTVKTSQLVTDEKGIPFTALANKGMYSMVPFAWQLLTVGFQ